MRSRRSFLDACLIVKNEEANLPDCLASLHRLQPLLGSVCVYDTGSTDRTIEIAREGGCVVTEGYWDDDFARARNEALALSGAEWALVIDADERVVADPARLERALRSVEAANVIDAELYHLDEAGNRTWHTRYIKAVRPDRIRFVHPVHEIVDGRSGWDVDIARLDPDDLYFLHLGYSSAEIRQCKAERNHAIADSAVETARVDGDRVLLAHALRHRARSWIGPGAAAAAIADFEEMWPLWTVGSAQWVTTGLDLADRQRSGGLLEAAQGTLDRLEAADTPRHLWLGAAAEIRLARNDLDEARRLVDDVLSLTAQGVPETDVEFDRRLALDLRLRIALMAQERDVAVAICLLLVENGEVERLVDVCRSWRGSADALASVLRRTATGPHGHDVVALLAGLPGLGSAVARRLSAAASQHGPPSVDGER